MQKYLILSLGFAALLLSSVPAAAQSAFDVTNCEPEDEKKVREAVDGALKRLTQVDNVRQDVFLANYHQSFGNFTEEEGGGWGGIIFAITHANIRALLTGGTAASLSNPPPTLPRVTFNCQYGPPVDIARYEGNGRVDLYVGLFSALPHSGYYDNEQGTRVGTILHESVHVLGGPRDVIVDGAAQNVSAWRLVQNKDGRTFTNAENYEWFYMSFLF